MRKLRQVFGLCVHRIMDSIERQVDKERLILVGTNESAGIVGQNIGQITLMLLKIAKAPLQLVQMMMRLFVFPVAASSAAETVKLVETAFERMEAIRAATYWPSVMMGVQDKWGTITPGKYADIIAVKGDVLRYINLLQDVDMVIKGGKRYK